MNLEQELKLQAWVDGELSEREAREIAALAETDPAARALAGELRIAKSFLAGNEPEVKLPESREFYWSKIEREIERADKVAAGAPQLSWVQAWRRMLAPLSGVVLVAFLSVVSLNLFHQGEVDDGLKYMVEVENLSDDVASISYKSQSENMFVVYLYDKDRDVEKDADLEPMDDAVIQ
jgi:hypothetical protein